MSTSNLKQPASVRIWDGAPRTIALTSNWARKKKEICRCDS
jgi:hypothetical protein